MSPGQKRASSVKNPSRAPVPRNGLVRQVQSAILRHSLLAPGQRILVAVSGGLDSMVLLDLLHRLAPVHGWRLVLVHFNHQLRGRSSDADAALVIRTAQRLKLPISVGRAEVRLFARRRGLSIEMAARELRHEFFAKMARRRRVSTIALAHHAGDQAELFFVRLLRGSATQGLAGMRVSSPSPADSSLRIVRPLLEVDRASLERYASEQKVVFREDATNRSTAFLRNRIRHELLPLLRNCQPAVDNAIARLTEIARAESDFVARAASEWMAGARANFRNLDVAVQRRCIAEELISLGVQPDFELIESLRTSPEKTVNAPGNQALILRERSGRIDYSCPAPGFDARSVRFELRSSRGSLVFDDVRLHWSIRRGNVLPKRAKAGCEFFDADRVGLEISLRHWRPGDRFQPIGMPGPVKLQDFLTNIKVPRRHRVKLLVAEDSTGTIFWVEGCRISEAHKLLPGTRRLLKIQWQRANPAVAGNTVKCYV